MGANNYARTSAPSGSNSQSWYSEDEEDEDLDGLRDPGSVQNRRRYASEIYRHNEEINRRRPLGVNQHVVRLNDHPPPFPRRNQESRNQHAASKSREEQRHLPSLDPRYANTESVGLPQQQSTSYVNRGRFSGNTNLHSSNPPIDQSYRFTPYSHQNKMPGHDSSQWKYVRPSNIASPYQAWPLPQQSNHPSPDLPSYYEPIRYPTPPSPLKDGSLVDASPPSSPNRELLALKEELKAMKERTKRARDADVRKEMEEQIRKKVEEEFQYQMECAKEAQERAKEEIEKIRTETEIATRKKMLAERHAQAERERLEIQQAIRFEREVRLKVEQERVAEEKAEKERARQRDEIEMLMREKMLQSMEELTSMARGKLMIGIEAEKGLFSNVTDVETNDETVNEGMGVKRQRKEMTSNSRATEYQKKEAKGIKQDIYKQSSDTGDVLERPISTPGSESQESHDRYRFGTRGGDETTEEQEYSTRDTLESRTSSDQLSDASVDSGATRFPFKMSGAHGDHVLPPAPDIPGMSDEDDWKSSGSRGSHHSSYRPKKSRRAHSTNADYPMNEEQHVYPGYQPYQGYHRQPEYNQERYPYQEYHQNFHTYPGHQTHQRYRPEHYPYPVSNPNPAQMGEFVEQVIDGGFSWLRVVSDPRWDLQKSQPPHHEQSVSRVETVSSISASDVESAYNGAATLQNKSLLVMENNLPNGHETPKLQTRIHIDVAAATAVATSHDEDEFYTPTESGEPAMNSYFESSIKDTDTDQETKPFAA